MIDVDSEVYDSSSGYFGNLALYGYASSLDFATLLNTSTTPLDKDAFNDEANRPNMGMSLTNNLVDGPQRLVEYKLTCKTLQTSNG